MPTWKKCFATCFFSFKLCICPDPRIARAYTAKNTKKKNALLACLAQPTYPIPARCGTDTAGRGACEPAPKTALERSYLTEKSSSENPILRPKRRKTPDRIPPKKNDHIYINKGSAWVPARAGTHASGWAGQHFKLFYSRYLVE